MKTYLITYLKAGGFGTRKISKDSIEEALVEFKQQLPLHQILQITEIK